MAKKEYTTINRGNENFLVSGGLSSFLLLTVPTARSFLLLFHRRLRERDEGKGERIGDGWFSFLFLLPAVTYLLPSPSTGSRSFLLPYWPVDG